jgi:hypothetical protein
MWLLKTRVWGAHQGALMWTSNILPVLSPLMLASDLLPLVWPNNVLPLMWASNILYQHFALMWASHILYHDRHQRMHASVEDVSLI